jgi:hypothetical protein
MSKRPKGHIPSALVALGFAAALLAANAPQPAAQAAAPKPAPPVSAPAAAAAVPKLGIAQILDKHAAARGGVQAWHAVQTLSSSGKMEVGFADSAARSARYVSSAASSHTLTKKELLALQAQSQAPAPKQVELPFVLELKRPNKSRVELEFNGKTAIQVCDGENGWLMRPYLNRDDWEPFSPEQAKMQAAEWGIEDPLIDYATKGSKAELEGVEPVDGHNAYKVKLTLKNGEVRRFWIDAQNFLDVKVEGTPRRMDGKMRTVWVYQRDFRTVQGLSIPFALETAIDGYRDTHKMTIEKLAVNPKLEDARFLKPQA